jgi:hypothetical protein
MKLKPKNKLIEHFSQIEDPRMERTKRHKLIDILTIAILAVICEAEVIAIDSKTLRQSYDSGDSKAAIHSCQCLGNGQPFGAGTM